MKKVYALEASAGSGKTFALSVRYIALLFQGASPSTIVALTFTKKAANEMKERIFETLYSLETMSAELDALSELLNMSKKNILQKRPKVMEKFLYAHLHVETIDAFFGKILRKFSLYVGLMPDFQTVSQNSQFYLEEIFTQYISKNHKMLRSLVKFMTNEQMRFDSIFSFFEILYEKLPLSIDKKFPIVSYPHTKNVMNAAQKIVFFLKKQNASKRAIGMFDVEDFDNLVSKTFWAKKTLQYSTFNKVYTQELDRLFFNLKEEYKKYCLQKEDYLLGEILNLYRAYEDVRISLGKKSNELTFSDVTKLTHALLHEEIGNDFLYFRLDAHIEHLLIDEFQDTNALQFDILKPIVSEILSGVGTSEKSFFYVGDTKQSIYRFRGGSKGLFELVSKEFNIPTESMQKNYRSDGVVVSFINDVFKEKIDHYVQQEPLAKKIHKGYVSVQEYEEVTEGIIKSISLLLQAKVDENDIAILCYTNSDASLISESLLEWKPSLSVSTHSTKSIIQTHEIKILIEYLKYLYFDHEIYAKNTLVLLGESFEKNIDKMQINWAWPLAKICILIVNFLELDGSNKDLLKFIEIANNFEDIENLLFELERIDSPSITEESGGIKVLTIHKSKGLEFPFVIIADKIGRENTNNGRFIFEHKDEKLHNIFIRLKNREYVDTLYEHVKNEEQRLHHEDRVNAQYVAFTRAKNGLIVVQKTKNSTFSHLDLQETSKGLITPLKKQKKHDQKQAIKLEKLPSFGLQRTIKESEEEGEYSIHSIYFGKALHYVLEIMGSFTQASLDIAYEAMRNKYGVFLAKIQMQDIYQRVQRLIQDATFKTLTCKGNIYKEQPLIYMNEKKQLDVLIENKDKLIIIDYKSSKNEHEENKIQVLLYKKALEDMQTKDVQAWLFYVREHEIKAINVD